MVTRAALIVLAMFAASPGMAQNGHGPASVGTVELPINLERLKQRLAALPRDDDERPLIEFYVEVYGQAPRVNPLLGFDLHSGPVNHGAPTHAEMMRQWTPEEFRTPVADLGALFNWLRKR